ncbi:hypothetical protein [Pseudomonas sp. NPDC007930]|uniref:hypothetical protein n=1 Tax=Pseudomonas sp. NPDC007930 TaxID=3364417 RepID=UPI0036EED16B
MEIFQQVALHRIKMQLGFLILNTRFSVDGLKPLHHKKVIKIRHVLFMKMAGAFSGEGFNHLNIHAGKRGRPVEIVVNNYGSHAVVNNLSSFRGEKKHFSCRAPSGSGISPRRNGITSWLQGVRAKCSPFTLGIGSQTLSLPAPRPAIRVLARRPLLTREIAAGCQLGPL